MLAIHPLSLDLFTARLKARNPFAFVRYGDGEFQAILGVKGKNCDGHEYFADMGRALAKTLTTPRRGSYLYALGPKAARGMRAHVTKWLQANAPDLEWHDTEVLLRASLQGELAPFVRMLRQRRVVMVGAQHLAALWNGTLLAEPQAHIITPDTNAWLEKERLARDIVRAAMPTNPNRRADVLLFSAGMVSKVLMWELEPLLGNCMSLLDTGSLWDMYCGKDSRSYARRLSVTEKTELATQNFSALDF